jgi:aminoglycoside phosphotransferase (APT) family kinase protein
MIARGWELFAEMAPADIWEATVRIREDPEPLLRELAQAETTLIHGDLRTANLAFDHDGRLLLFDWGIVAQAPAEVEFARWLAQGFRAGCSL